MSENYVTREEFENLKEKVVYLETEVTESKKLLQTIDKKIDIINEKIVTADKIEELKLAPIIKRIEKVEEGTKWLSRTVIGSIITVVIGAIVYVIKQM
jgi:hypothetical protein